MSRIPSTGSTQTVTDQRGANDLRDVDLDEFLQLLITEMQNQDPLNPMDNSEVLQQIGQLREISATNQMQETLATVQQGQNLATASGLIGKEVKALSDDNTDVTGVVDRVSIEIDSETEERTLKAHIGTQSFKLGNIREINGVPVEGETTEGSETTE